MSLKLWLPLNGSTVNQGLSGTTMSGSPNSWSNEGKIGKCAVFNNDTTNCIYSTSSDYNYTTEDFSWCMWIKKDYSSVTAATMYSFTVGRADGGGYGYGMQIISTGIRPRFGSSYWSMDMADGEWHHVAFTKLGTTISLYLDGVLQQTDTFSGTQPTYSDGNGVGVGCFYYKNKIYPLIGSLNDFRIYDHALSAKEVYQISRGLCLHYSMRELNNGRANPNLFMWTNGYTQDSPMVHTSSRTDGILVLGAVSYIPVKPSTTYFFQVKCDGTVGTHTPSAATVTDNFTVWIYGRIYGTTKTIGNYDTTYNFTSSNLYYSDVSRNLYIWKWTSGDNAQDIIFRTNSYSDGSTSVTLHFWDFKFEEASSWSAYTPSPLSPEYAALGYIVNANLLTGTSMSLASATVGQYYAAISSSATFYGLSTGNYVTISVYLAAPSTKGIAISVLFYTSDDSSSSLTGNVIEAGKAGFSAISFKLTSAQRAYSHMDILLASADTTVTSSDTVYYRRLKMEKGNARTEWIPYATEAIPGTESSPRYPATETTVRDESGMGNDSIAVRGQMTVSFDSPRNSTCLVPSQQSYIRFHLPEQMTAATYSFWVKPGTTSAYRGICYSVSSPVTASIPWLSVNTESRGVWAYIAGSAASQHYHSAGGLLSNEWHHCCWIFNCGTCAWYLDGSHVGTDQTQSSLTAIPNTTDISLGDCYSGTSWAGTPMTDPISDFRVYATALTADDVKSLYSVGASIDNAGRLFCGEIDETGTSASAQKNSVFSSAGVNEPGGCAVVINSSTPSGKSNYHTESYSYTPAADTNNSCITGYRIVIPDTSPTLYRIEIDVAYSGFDTSSTAGTFSMRFQGMVRNRSTSEWSWSSNAFSSALGTITSTVLSATSGKTHMSVASDLGTWLQTYDAANLGLRTNYSNGTGTVTISNLRIYPERDYKDMTCSINSDGTVSTKELNEALF